MNSEIYGQPAADAWKEKVRPRLEKGICFAHNGRTAEGLDCVGLLIWAYRECGFDIKEPEETGRYPLNYWKNASPVLLLPALQRYASKIEPARMASGDILVFQSMSRPAHVGILDDTQFWHILHPEGLQKESLVRSAWTLRMRVVLRLRAVTKIPEPVQVTASFESAMLAQQNWGKHVGRGR